MKYINTFKGQMPLEKYHKILAHEHLLIDMTHEAVTPNTEEEKEVFFGKVTMDKLGILRRNPYIVRENLMQAPLYQGKIEGIGARYCPSFEDTAKAILREAREGDVVVIMGAGDVYHVFDYLADKLEK